MQTPQRQNEPTPDPSQLGVPLAGLLIILVSVGLVGALLLSGQSGLMPGWLGADASASPTPDPFADVRAEAQAAFERGQHHFEREEFELALLELDRARVNDPDGRDDIETLLERTLDELRSQVAMEPTTVPLPPAATPTPYTVYLSDQPAPQPTEPPAEPQPTATPAAPPAAEPAPVATHRYTSQEQAFSLDVPSGWELDERPEAEAGVGVVGVHAPDSGASFVVSVDMVGPSVSPELYSAHLDTAMQNLPGYSLEQATLTAVAGTTGWRRLYLVKPPSLAEGLRTVQVVVGQQSRMFILTGTAPENEFAWAAGSFERMLASFRISL